MKEILELYTINNRVLNNAIDKIVVKLHGINKQDGSKMFLLTGAGANGGTTTVGISVAISLAEAGWRTLFIDADLRKDQKFKRISVGDKTTLTDYLTGDISVFRKVTNRTNVDNLDYVIAGEKNDNPVRLLCNAKMETFLEWTKDNYDFVIIDTPPIGITNDAEILIPLIDKFLIVVSLNETRKRQLVEARMQLAEYEDKYIGTVVNNMEIMQYKNIVKDYDYYIDKNLRRKHRIGMNKRKDS